MTNVPISSGSNRDDYDLIIISENIFLHYIHIRNSPVNYVTFVFYAIYRNIHIYKLLRSLKFKMFNCVDK
jgi:hypothetical protein